MIYFDDKQKKLINSWHNLSEKSDDPYMSFMSDWIVFNAICFNLYNKKAVIERANIDRKKSKLEKINQKFNPNGEIIVENAKISGTYEKWNIDLTMPERLYISVTNKYTEDIIFNEFVKDNSEWYLSNVNENQSLFENLKMSLRKNNRNFVIDITKSLKLNLNNDFDKLVSNNAVVFCEVNDLKTIKNVLYQVRCNIFHGEKIPGDLNDDKIVISALPLLKLLVNYLIKLHKINNVS
jgi:hypothetical protein